MTPDATAKDRFVIVDCVGFGGELGKVLRELNEALATSTPPPAIVARSICVAGTSFHQLEAPRAR